MTHTSRLDRLIVRLCFVRNLLTKHSHEIDFDLDLHAVEAEITTLYETALTQAEEISNDNARN
jgi:hypothetical protein